MGADIVEHETGKFSRAVYIKGGSANPLVFKGTVTTATSSTVFASTNIIGQGDDAFKNDWYVYVFHDAGGAAAAPQGEYRPISDYVSSTGTFTHTAFTADLVLNDEIFIVHRSLVDLMLSPTASSDMTEEVADGSVISRMLSKTSDTSTYDPTTDAQEMLSDKLGAFTGDGGADQDDSAKSSLDIAHTDLGTIIANTSPAEIIENIFDIDMGYWTEVDVPGRVTVDYTNERIAIADLDNDEDVYVYKATDANVTDFILDFEFQVLNTTAGVNAMFGIGLADSIGSMEDAANGMYVNIFYTGVNDTHVQIMHKTNGADSSSDAITTLLDDTMYYGRLIRRGSYCWLGIYSDRIRETHMAGSPVEYNDASPVAFTHLYPVTGYDDATPGVGRAMDAYVEAIKLISSPDIDKYLGMHVA